MKKVSVKKNYVYNLLYQIVMIFIPIVMTPYLSRVLGANSIGIYGYTYSIVSYFILVGTFGMNLYGQREIAFYQTNKNKCNQIFSQLFILRLFIMFISIIIFIILFCSHSEFDVFFKIYLFELLANMIDISWFYQGIEEFKKVLIRNLIVKFFSIFLILFFVKKPSDLDIYIIIQSVSNLLGNLLLWKGFNSYVKFAKVNISDMLHLFKPLFFMFIPQISIHVYSVLDKTMLGVILGEMSEVGFYEQSQKIVRILLTIVTSLGIVMMPRVANCFSLKKYHQLKRYIEKSFSLVFFISFPLMFGIIIVSPNFIPLFLGEGFDKVSFLLPFMSFLIIPVAISNVTGNMILIPQNLQRKYSISVFAGAIINFILNIFLIYFFGVLGAIISTVVSEFVISLLQIYYVRHVIKFKEILFRMKNYFFSSIIMFFCCILVNFLNLNIIVTLILKILIGFVVYVVMLFIFKDPFFIYLLEELKKFLLKFNLIL